MHICMNERAHYAQSRIWTQCFVGPLTDKAITRYAQAGHYGPEMQRAFTPPPKSPRRRKEKWCFVKLLAEINKIKA